jgi:SAM-dependent methyltransferase
LSSATDLALKGPYYAECQKVFRASTNQDELMLSALLQHCSDLNDFSILSVGSGSGLFELPMLEVLFNAGKRVSHFVGVDIDEDANQLLLNALDSDFAGRLQYEVVSASFDTYQSSAPADLILYNHVFEYIRDGHISWMRKSLDLLAKSGKLLLFSPIQGGINAIYEDNMSSHFDYAPYYSADIETMLSDEDIPFTKERIQGECDVSLLAKLGEDADAMRLLSFLTQVDARQLADEKAVEQVLYFQSLADQDSPLIPHPTDLFILAAQ